MRISADAGGMESVSFDDIDAQVNQAIGDFAGALAAASGAAGDGGLSGAIDDISGALRAADSSAALSLANMSRAVAKAAGHYVATDGNVARAAG